jgi:hypothetical protein
MTIIMSGNQFLTTDRKWKKMTEGFSEQWNFRHSCGRIDYKHVRINAPTKGLGEDTNYK